MNDYIWTLVIGAAVAFFGYATMVAASNTYHLAEYAYLAKDSDYSADEIYKKSSAGRKQSKKNALLVAIYIMLVGVMLTATMYIGNMSIQNEIVAKCIGAGGHLVVFYLVNALILRFFVKRVFGKTPARRKLEYVFCFGLLFFSLMVIHAYWELSLWAIVLLAGNYIWFDLFFYTEKRMKSSLIKIKDFIIGRYESFPEDDRKMLYFFRHMVGMALVFDVGILLIRIFGV